MQIPQHRDKLGHRVFMIRLSERQVSFRIGVVPEEMRNLFENQNHANRRQKSLDDAAGKKRGKEPGSGESQSDLDLSPRSQSSSHLPHR